MRPFIHQRLRLHALPTKWVLEPCAAKDDAALEAERCLTIERSDASVGTATRSEVGLVGNDVGIEKSLSMMTHGLIGFVPMLSGVHMIVIVEQGVVGEIQGHAVHNVVKAELIRLTGSSEDLSSDQQNDEDSMLAQIDNIVSSGNIYFSYTLDMTNCWQRRALMGKTAAADPLWRIADNRFFWNGALFSSLLMQNGTSGNAGSLGPFVLPVILGYVKIADVKHRGRPFRYIFISRRSRFRAGTRYHMRGVDSTGDVANHVETEQAVIVGTRVASFVQTRGSIPAFWKQVTGMRYRPKPTLNHGLLYTTRAFRRHFERQLHIYGDQLLINLIGQTGREMVLCNTYKEQFLLYKNPRLRYVAFDFHKECHGMDFSRLSHLIAITKTNLTDMRYFSAGLGSGDSADASSQPPDSTQLGVVRTNCTDCLDRTNVVQTLFARRTLTAQLQEMGVLDITERLEDDKDFEFFFKNVWADNADYLSKQYTTTGALKADFTRTGKRRIAGLLQDAANSMVRYYQNTFQDDIRQDAIDLLAGRVVLNANARPPTGPDNTETVASSSLSSTGTAAAPTAAPDKMHRVVVMTGYKVLATGDRRPVTFEISSAEATSSDGGQLTWITRGGVSQTLNLSGLVQIEKDDIDMCRLRLIFTEPVEPCPCDICLPSVGEREIFVYRLRHAAGWPTKRDTVPCRLLIASCRGDDPQSFDRVLDQLGRVIERDAKKRGKSSDWEAEAEASDPRVGAFHPDLVYKSQVEMNIMRPAHRANAGDDATQASIDSGPSPQKSGARPLAAEGDGQGDVGGSGAQGSVTTQGTASAGEAGSSSNPLARRQGSSGGIIDHPLSDELEMAENLSSAQGTAQRPTRSTSKVTSELDKLLAGEFFLSNKGLTLSTSRGSPLDPDLDIFVAGVIGAGNVIRLYHKLEECIGDRFEPLVLRPSSDACIIIFVKSEFVNAITNLRTSTASLDGGQGAGIAVSFHVHETRVCFLLVSLPPRGATLPGRYIGAMIHKLRMGKPDSLMDQHHHMFIIGCDVMRDQGMSATLPRAGQNDDDEEEDGLVAIEGAAGDDDDDDDEEAGVDEGNSGRGTSTASGGGKPTLHRATTAAELRAQGMQPHFFMYTTSYPRIHVESQRLRSVQTSEGLIIRANFDGQPSHTPVWVGGGGTGANEPASTQADPASASAGREGWVVAVKDLTITDLHVPKKRRDAAVYVVITVLSGQGRCQSPTVRGGRDPRWGDNLLLRTLPMSLDHLQKQFLLVTVFARDSLQEDVIVGSGVVPISRTAKCTLSLRGGPVGVLQCVMRVSPLTPEMLKRRPDLVMQSVQMTDNSIKAVAKTFAKVIPSRIKERREQVDQLRRMALDRMERGYEGERVGIAGTAQNVSSSHLPMRFLKDSTEIEHTPRGKSSRKARRSTDGREKSSSLDRVVGGIKSLLPKR